MPKDQPVDGLRESITALITELGGDWYYDGQIFDPTENIEYLASKLIELFQAECNRASQEAYKRGYAQAGIDYVINQKPAKAILADKEANNE